ncbi:MAG: hypothetical protein AAGG07_05810 [Planctomycetota bacterium]
MKPAFLLYIVFHPASDASRTLARRLHSFLNDNPVEPGLRVGTRFCPETPDRKPPAALDLAQAGRNFVVVLADAHLNTDDAWRSYVGDLGEQLDGELDRLMPIQLSSNAWPLDPRLKTTNFARAYADEDPERYAERVLLTELCRHLGAAGTPAPGDPAPTEVFLSHTKLDIDRPPRVFDAFIRHLNAKHPVAAWVDCAKIGSGDDFEARISAGASQTSMLCLLTDRYSSREYCRTEVLLAKRYDRPLVVVDALQETDKRGFPYLGNATVVRWADNPSEIIDVLLKELLRNLIAESDLERQATAGETVFRRPPEVLTVLERCGRKGAILYPDPPLGRAESHVVKQTGVTLTTPLQRVTQRAPLKHRTIALSLSESTDIRSNGLDSVHLDSTTLDLCRYLLAAGATLAYGGHIGSKGYTEQLGNLVRAYNNLDGVDPVARIRNYRGWPLPRLTVEQRDDRAAIARVIETDRPADVDETMNPAFVAAPTFFPATTSPEHRFAWARGMTEMRVRQTDETAARIVLGGTFGPTEKVNDDGTQSVKWYSGLMPGVLEEVLISAERGHPVFLIGAFGGVARLVFDLIEGVERPEATWEYQRDCPDSVQLRDLYHANGMMFPDYRTVAEELRSQGLEGLNPLLNEAEHRELATTLDTEQMVELLVKGLSQLNPPT